MYTSGGRGGGVLSEITRLDEGVSFDHRKESGYYFFLGM